MSITLERITFIAEDAHDHFLLIGLSYIVVIIDLFDNEDSCSIFFDVFRGLDEKVFKVLIDVV